MQFYSYDYVADLGNDRLLQSGIVEKKSSNKIEFSGDKIYPYSIPLTKEDEEKRQLFIEEQNKKVLESLTANSLPIPTELQHLVTGKA